MRDAVPLAQRIEIAYPVQLVDGTKLRELGAIAALVLYYIALRRTPASRAALAELAFPLTAAAVGVTLLDGRLDASQWLGFAVVLTSVVSLALHEHRARRPAVAVPDRVEDALA